MSVDPRQVIFPDPSEAIENDNAIEKIYISGEADIRCLVFLPDGKFLNEDGNFRSKNGINLSPSGRYLITCSDVWGIENDIHSGLDRTSELLIWDTKKGNYTSLEKKKLSNNDISHDFRSKNYLSCMDGLLVNTRGKKSWLVCGGTLNGEVYINFPI